MGRLCGGGLNRRRGAVLDGGERGRIYARSAAIIHDEMDTSSKSAFSESRRRRSGRSGKNGMSSDPIVHAAGAAVHFSRIVGGLQVVGDGNDREENRNEHGERNELHAPARAVAHAEAQPRDNHQDGQRGPGEIEEQFHA